MSAFRCAPHVFCNIHFLKEKTGKSEGAIKFTGGSSLIEDKANHGRRLSHIIDSSARGTEAPHPSNRNNLTNEKGPAFIPRRARQACHYTRCTTHLSYYYTVVSVLLCLVYSARRSFFLTTMHLVPTSVVARWGGRGAAITTAQGSPRPRRVQAHSSTLLIIVQDTCSTKLTVLSAASSTSSPSLPAPPSPSPCRVSASLLGGNPSTASAPDTVVLLYRWWLHIIPLSPALPFAAWPLSVHRNLRCHQPSPLVWPRPPCCRTRHLRIPCRRLVFPSGFRAAAPTAPGLRIAVSSVGLI